MGKKTFRKLLFRGFLFIGALVLMLWNPKMISGILNFELFMGIKVFHIFWLYLLLEMLPVLFSKLKQESYCGKHFHKHYQAVQNYKEEKLRFATKKSNRRAMYALVFWLSLNAMIFSLYFLLDLGEGFVYLLFLFYYFADMICVNVWCPFHSIILKNKCCNECRIYNWGHWMYFTPFVLVPNFWTWSLLLISLVIFLQWEFFCQKYPERFSSVTNQTLQCQTCVHECRYNSFKKKKRKEKKG